MPQKIMTLFVALATTAAAGFALPSVAFADTPTTPNADPPVLTSCPELNVQDGAWDNRAACTNVLQQALKNEGYPDQDPAGEYLGGTQQAVLAYQYNNPPLTTTGNADPDTLTAVSNGGNPPPEVVNCSADATTGPPSASTPIGDHSQQLCGPSGATGNPDADATYCIAAFAGGLAAVAIAPETAAAVAAAGVGAGSAILGAIPAC